jgi:hypothetical protein
MQLLTTRSTAVIGAVILTFGVVAACGASGHGNAEVEPGGVDNSKARIIQMPDGFRNVAAKCDGSTMVYSGSRGETSDKVGSGIAVVPNDPRCPGVKSGTGATP